MRKHQLNQQRSDIGEKMAASIMAKIEAAAAAIRVAKCSLMA